MSPFSPRSVALGCDFVLRCRRHLSSGGAGHLLQAGGGTNADAPGFIVDAGAANGVQANQPGQIRIEGDGAVADFGPHHVFFPANLSASAVTITFMDGEVLAGSPIGICYYTSDGQSVMIAELRDCVGTLLPPNQVVYTNCYDSVSVDVSFLYTVGSLEQDLVIRRQLPDPATLGLSGDVRLAVITAFTNAPVPVIVPDQIDLADYNLTNNASADSLLPDQTIVFNTMSIIQGRAFLIGDTGLEIPVVKSWQELSSIPCLVESVPYSLIQPQLGQLPPATASLTPGRKEPLATAIQRLAHARHTPAFTARMAVANSPLPGAAGLVWDYLIVSTHVLNINFGSVSAAKSGFAAAGESTNDYWNGYSFTSTNNITLTNLLWSDTNASGANLTVLNAPGTNSNPVSDGMFQSYVSSTTNITLTLTNLASGTYDFYIYSHGNSSSNNGILHLVSQGIDYGTNRTTTIGTNFVLHRELAGRPPIRDFPQRGRGVQSARHADGPNQCGRKQCRPKRSPDCARPRHLLDGAQRPGELGGRPRATPMTIWASTTALWKARPPSPRAKWARPSISRVPTATSICPRPRA